MPMTYDQLEKRATDAYHDVAPPKSGVQFDPTIIAVILEVVMQFLSGCAPKQIKDRAKMPVLARMLIRQKLPRGLTFSESREVADTVLRMAQDASEKDIADARAVALPDNAN